MPAATEERRYVIAPDTETRPKQGLCRRVVTYGSSDPNGYSRYIPEAEVAPSMAHYAGLGYRVEDQRPPAPRNEAEQAQEPADDDEWLTAPLDTINPDGSPKDPPAEAPRGEVEQAPAAPEAPVLRKVAPGDIITDGGTQARADMSEETVDEYAAEMRAGVVFPPVVLFEDDEGNLWCSSGFHRIGGALKAGLQGINAEVRRGTRRDAILFSCGENSEHGLRRTRADKRHAVKMLLEDEEWRDWSAERIGQFCRVGGDLVLAMKREMGLTSVNGGKVTYQRAGTVTTMDTAGMARGTQPAAPAVTSSQNAGPALPPADPPRVTTSQNSGPATYPSERQAPPAPSGPRLPEPPSDDDRTPAFTVRTMAEACWAAVTALREHGGPIRDREAIGIIAQHIQDAVTAAKEGRL